VSRTQEANVINRKARISNHRSRFQAPAKPPLKERNTYEGRIQDSACPNKLPTSKQSRKPDENQENRRKSQETESRTSHFPRAFTHWLRRQRRNLRIGRENTWTFNKDNGRGSEKESNP